MKIAFIVKQGNSFLTNVVPFASDPDITKAKTWEVDLANPSSSDIGAFTSDLEALINTTGTLDYEFLIYDALDTAFVNVIGDGAFLKTGVTYRITAALSQSDMVALRNVCVEIVDQLSTTILGFLMMNIATVTPNSTSSGNAQTPSNGTLNIQQPSGLDELIADIKRNTKADIVKPKETLQDYVCEQSLMDELQEVVDFFNNAQTFQSLNIVPPKGILFKGVPGTGKTYAARCIAGTVDCYFMTCTASSLQGMYVGSGAENIRAVFKGAKMLRDVSKKGVILFIDELDSFGSRENHGGGGGGSEEDRTLNQLLAEMSGFENDPGIMILGATNFPERIDEAMLRSGRFSRQITIDPPDVVGRTNLLQYYYGKIKMPLNNIGVNEIAALTEGFTPADISELANCSAILAVREKKTDIDISQINEAINRTITKNVRKPSKPAMVKIVTIHECGHVLAEFKYLNRYSVKVTNYSYGNAGGFTQPKKDDLGLFTKEAFIGEVKSLLGGRAAEAVLLPQVTTGASDDIKRAKRLIRQYFEVYHFEPYKSSELDQKILDTLEVWMKEVCDDFNSEKPKLQALCRELHTKRVLYTTDIVKILY